MKRNSLTGRKRGDWSTQVLIPSFGEHGCCKEYLLGDYGCLGVLTLDQGNGGGSLRAQVSNLSSRKCQMINWPATDFVFQLFFSTSQPAVEEDQKTLFASNNEHLKGLQFSFSSSRLLLRLVKEEEKNGKKKKLKGGVFHSEKRALFCF